MLDGFETRVRRSIGTSIAVKTLLLSDSKTISTIIKAAELLVSAFQQGRKAIFFGNGGSAADAQHIAAELVGRFTFDRPPIAAMALNVNSSSVTAIANDYGFEYIFSRQIEAFARNGDVAVGISTSGTSSNVIQAFCTASKMGLHTIALTGSAGGVLRDLVDYCVCIPSAETPRIQEAHILVGHILTELVEVSLSKKWGPRVELYRGAEAQSA